MTLDKIRESNEIRTAENKMDLIFNLNLYLFFKNISYSSGTSNSQAEMLLDFFFSVLGQFSVFRIRHPSVVGCRKNPSRCSLHVIGGCLNIFYRVIGRYLAVYLRSDLWVRLRGCSVYGEVVLGSKFRLL